MKVQENFKYQPIICKSALNHIDSFLPYHWDLNIYRGCEHQCAYCYAQYSHRYLDDEDFFHHIFVKQNIVAVLEKKLQSRTWKREVINLGGVTDSYQPAEKIYQIMPEILKLLIRYKTPAIISTKSSLILRDISLLKQLSEVAGLQVACTITTLDQELANQLEPHASPISERIDVIRRLKAEGISVGWHLMPIIPYLTATKSNLTNIFKTARECQVDYMITGMLNLRGPTRQHFFEFIKNVYPAYYTKLWTLYHDKEQKNRYKKMLSQVLTELANEYQVSRDYHRYVPQTLGKETQLSFFS